MHDAYQALYIHIPFCKQRCLYCDFATEATDDKRIIGPYIDTLVLDIRRAANEGKLSHIKTVYIGGGTPSHIDMKYLTTLLYTLSTSMHLSDDVEFSMEANPESLTEPMVRDLWALGVNRLSIGVQSFDDALLTTITRPHDAQTAKSAVDVAHTRFKNVSIDLMCGIPGQTLEGFAADIDTAIHLGVTHISIYPLTVEKGTPLAKLVRKGKISLPDDDMQASMMEDAAAKLAQAGFHRYEVASYARSNYECRHNIAYWTGVPYLGFGQSAVTMTQDGMRRMRVQDGGVIDDLDKKQMVAEDLMLGMRMTRGVDDDQVKRASEILPAAITVFHHLCEEGLVVHEGGRYRPTERGWLVGNELFGEIFDLAP